MDSERTTTITDVGVMRALAHPARLALIDHLAATGPATATDCAGVVNLTPSATSYHLRALAKVGMVEEAPGRGDGRERFWRSTVAGYRIEGGPEEDPEAREAKAELIDTFIVWEESLLRQYLARVPEEPKEWQEATNFSGATLLLTADELVEITDAVREVFHPYRKRNRKDAPADARTVFAMVRAFPTDPPVR